MKKDRPVDKNKGFFIAHCINHENLFQSMFILSKKRDYFLKFLQALTEKKNNMKQAELFYENCTIIIVY